MIHLKEAEAILNKTVKKQLSKKPLTVEEKKWIEGKARHSREVLAAGLEIMEREAAFLSLEGDKKEWAKVALLLHDIGRFYQFRDGELDFSLVHGKLGVEILMKHYNLPYNPFLFLPIVLHDQIDFSDLFIDDRYKTLDHREQDKVLLISKLVKDADKIANYRVMVQGKEISLRERKLLMVPEVLAAFYAGRLAKKQDEKTCFDSMIGFLCWQFELFFETSQVMMKEENINRCLIKRLREVVDKVRDEYFTRGEDRVETERRRALLIAEVDRIENMLI